MSTDRYKIGEFTLDVSRGCLRRGDIEIALRPKSFALLQHLITHAGRLVTKDELLSKIWPNVIVLPFANLNADPAQDYLGDIITSELITALSRLRGATVVAASSALTLKGKPADIKKLGADLDVRYALEGSVLRSEGSVRISASLKDTQTLKTLWSDRFDVDRADILRTQDEIVTRLASTLHGELVQADTRRSTTAGASNLDAEDLAMQCEASAYLASSASMRGYALWERALNKHPR